jgi:dolichyl-phosphate beta-glucosyltransferase
MSGFAHLAIGAIALATALWLGSGEVVSAPDAWTILGAAAVMTVLARGARAIGLLVLSGPERSPLFATAVLRTGVFRQRGAAAALAAGGPRSDSALVLQNLYESAGCAGALCAGLALGVGSVVAAAPFGALAIALLLRPRLPVGALRWLAERFPGHVSPGFASSFGRAQDPSVRPAPRLSLALAVGAAWLLDVGAAHAALRAFGFEAGPAEASFVAVATHLGVSILPRAAGLGVVELLALFALGFAAPSEASALPGVIAFHAFIAVLTVGAGALATRRVGFRAGPEAASAAAATRRAAEERRRRAAAFIAKNAKGDGPWLSVVVPAYNEARRITPTLLSALLYLRERRAPFEILVVDDGSRDDTGRVVEEFAAEHPEVRLLSLPHNMGKGAAVRTGARAAEGAWILVDDADGATPVVELERLVAAAARGADVAIGSRALAAPDVGIERRLVRAVTGRIFAFLVNALAVPGIADTQCGFKLFRRDAAAFVFGRQRLDGFAFDVELLYLARRGGYRIDEVPVNWMNVAGSKVGLGPGLRAFADVVRVRRLHSTDAELGKRSSSP